MTLETFEWQCIFSHECFPVEVYYFKNWAQKGIAFSISYCYLFSVHNMIIKFSGIQNNNIFNMNVCVNLSDFSVLPETSSKDWINPRLKIIMKFFLLWQSVTHIYSAQNKKNIQFEKQQDNNLPARQPMIDSTTSRFHSNVIFSCQGQVWLSSNCLWMEWFLPWMWDV